MNATFVRADGFGLVMVNKRDVDAFSPIACTVNALLISGGVNPGPMKSPNASGNCPTVTVATTVLVAVSSTETPPPTFAT